MQRYLEKCREIYTEKVGATVKNSDVEVTHCQLGCFHERKGHRESKNKIWIEDDNENLIFGGGKTQILEYIDETGSIAEAAKKWE